MKLKKLLVLSATCILTLGVAACGNNNESSASSVTPTTSETSVSSDTTDYKAYTKEAAEYVWGLYNGENNKAVSDSFQVIKAYRNFEAGVVVDITWELIVTSGVQEGAVSLTDEGSTDVYQNVYVGFYDGKVTEETTFKLVPSFKVHGQNVTATWAEYYSGKDIVRKVNKLVMNTYEDYCTASKNKAKDTITIKGVISAVAKNKGQYIWFQDADGHGYTIYDSKSSYKEGYEAGDTVIVSGQCSNYSGGYQFSSPSIKVISHGGTVGYKDVTTIFHAAKTAKDTEESLRDIASTKVEIKNVTLDSIGGYNNSYYYFTGEGGAQGSIYWSTSYMLSKDELNTWANLFKAALGLKATVRGIDNISYNAHSIYTIGTDAVEITDTDANIANKSKENLEGFASFYAANAEVTLPTSDILGSEITWSMKTGSSSIFAIADGKLKITPTATELGTGTIVASVKHGESTVTKEFNLKGQILTDEQIANNVHAELTALDKSVYGGVVLPTTSEVYGGTISYKIKTATEGYSVSGNKLIVPQVASDTEIVVTATVKAGEKTVEKDYTFVAKHTSTIAEIMAAKDKTNLVYVRGIITSFGGTSGEQSFTLYDGTNHAFSYNKLLLTDFKVGDEIVIATAYGVNNDVNQLATDNTKVIKLSSGNALPTTPDVSKTVDEISAECRAEGAVRATVAATYVDKLIEVKDAYVYKNAKGEYQITNSATSTTSLISGKYTSVNFDEFIGKKVTILGVCRGVYVGKTGNITLQSISVKLAAE